MSTTTFQRRRPVFPWAKHRDVELQVCSEFISGEARTIREMMAFVTKKTGIEVPEGALKHRLYSSFPPTEMINEIGTGPMSWKELWLLGATIAKRDKYRSWPQVIRQHIGPKLIGEPLDLPEDVANRLRAYAQRGIIPDQAPEPQTKPDIDERMRDLDMADRLGMSKTQELLFTNALSSLHGKDRVADLLFKQRGDFLRYWQSVSLGISKVALELLKEKAVTAAFLVFHKDNPDGAEVGDFFDSIATGEFEYDSPQDILWRFYLGADRASQFPSVREKGELKFLVLFAATLVSIQAYTEKKTITIETLNQLIGIRRVSLVIEIFNHLDNKRIKADNT